MHSYHIYPVSQTNRKYQFTLTNKIWRARARGIWIDEHIKQALKRVHPKEIVCVLLIDVLSAAANVYAKRIV